MPRREILGVMAAALSSLLGGTAVAATRFIIANTDPASLGLARYGIGSLCLAVFLGGALRRPRREDLIPISLLGVLFFAVFPWLFNKSLTWTTAAHGSLALSAMPLLTLVVAATLGVERLTIRKIVGVAMALLGVAVALSDKLAGPGLEGAWRGDLVMVGAALCGAIYNVLARSYLKRYPALIVTAYAMLGGTAGLALLTGVEGAPLKLLSLSSTGWLIILYLGVVGAAFTFWLWSFGLERTSPTRTAITVTLNPVTATVIGTLVLNEPLTPYLLLGFGSIIFGIALANWQKDAESMAAVKAG